MKQLQSELGVRIRVPRPDAPPGAAVTVHGTRTACDACEERLWGIVEEMARGKTKPKANKKTSDVRAPWPSKCPLCRTKLDTVRTTYQHLGSPRHFHQVTARQRCALDAAPGSENILGIAAFLQEANVAELHAKLGFNVQALLEAAPELERYRRKAAELQNAIAREPALFEWLLVEQRWCSAWDESPPRDGTTLDIHLAPPFEEIEARCVLDERPPLIRAVALPVSLPRGSLFGKKDRQSKAKHLFPFCPSSRLGLIVLLKRRRCCEEFDVVCGTSLIKALSGDHQRCADTYYLQRFRGAVCCLHVARHFHDQDDVGHSVELLLCGGDSKRPQSFFCSSSVLVGSRRLLITSEVDARDEQGSLVEIKTSSTKCGAAIITPSTSLQVACNGSDVVLCCGLDPEKMQLKDLEPVPASAALEQHRQSLVRSGQRVRHLLEALLADPLLGEADGGPVLKLTFDDIKRPVLEPAARDVAVLPEGLPC